MVTLTRIPARLFQGSGDIPSFDLGFRGVSGGTIKILSTKLSFRALYASSFLVHEHVNVILLTRVKMKATFVSAQKSCKGVR